VRAITKVLKEYLLLTVLESKYLVRAHFLLCRELGFYFALSSHGQVMIIALLSLLIRALTPFTWASPSGPDHLPKAPTPNTITLGIRFQHVNLG
jgi:hypothetical protein